MNDARRSKDVGKLEQLLLEVNFHLPEGLKLAPPITKKAMRYARSCLAYTYQSESMGTEGARLLGPLNATLDKIEEIVAKEKDARDSPPPPKTEPPRAPSASTTTQPPRPPPPPTQPRKTTTTPPSSSAASSEPRPRWRDADPDNETVAERQFREALEAVERANAEKRDPHVAQSQQAREALDVVDRYLHGEHAGAAASPEAKLIQELRRALLLTFQRRTGRPG
ncbi:MAG: hypothetical protein Q8O67_08935 [Deltaproteobacteria bacterium]|nr:hypothetical protein [Deltaproteobacteria bacterium]